MCFSRGFRNSQAKQLGIAVVSEAWVYDDLNQRASVRAKVMLDPEWQALLKNATQLLSDMHSAICANILFSTTIRKRLASVGLMGWFLRSLCALNSSTQRLEQNCFNPNRWRTCGSRPA